MVVFLITRTTSVSMGDKVVIPGVGLICTPANLERPTVILFGAYASGRETHG
jgi:predicted nucleotidyltransferase